MNLDRSKWYVQWFFWSLGIWDEFTENNRVAQCEETGTNLCFFIRVMLVWAPLVIMLHLAVFALIIYALTAYPILRFGGSRYGWGIGAILTLALMIFGISWVRGLRGKRSRREYQRRYRDNWDAPAPTLQTRQHPVETSPSFLKVLLEWVAAKKKLICPGITFHPNKETAV